MSTYVTRYKADYFDIGKYTDNLETLHGAVNRALGCSETGRTAANGLFYLYEDESSETAWLYVQADREAGEIEHFRKDGVICLDRKYEAIREGNMLEFRLRCSPMRHRRADDKRVYVNEAEKRASWLQRQGERMGFQLIGYREEKKADIPFEHLNPEMQKGTKASKTVYDVYGRLIVTDLDRFLEALKKGVGSGKAYGCGMVLVR